MTVVTRFPPSPTGFMHIGNARTALFNWLYAKRKGGKMVFRIEDTDRERHSEAAVEAIINGMRWLGLDWDGEIISQFSRAARHAEIAHTLLEKGQAYYCYCTPEELETMREQAKAQGRPTFYDRRWRDSKQTPPADVKPVIRIKAPLTGESTVHDHVQGNVTIQNEQLDDFILLRSDGVPTYMLAVVVDDHDMGVTHVIRGDDHLNNTFRQNVIIDAMGWKQPDYAHVPLILAEDGTKMSKRKGAASVEEYRAMGYLPEALCNYLLRLGWGHGDDEIISREQAIDWFDLDGIVKSPARWDYDKLNHLNAHYIKLAGDDRLLSLLEPLMAHPLAPHHKERLMVMMPDLKARAVTLKQMAEEGAFLAMDAPIPHSPTAMAILTEEAKVMLTHLHERFEAAQSFTAPVLEQICRALAAEQAGNKLGKVMIPLRAALTGGDKSPSLFLAAEALGKTETLRRISDAIKTA